MRGLVLIACLVAPGAALADDTELDRASVIYARGSMLYKSDGKGNGEVELAKLPHNGAVRALRTDARGNVLLVDVDGKWSWMPLDGSAKTLVDLPCAEGPAQLARDGGCVLCRARTGPGAAPSKSIIFAFKTGKQIPVDVPAVSARLVGDGAGRKLVWADTAVWAAPLTDLKKKTKVAPAAPLRGFLPNADGTRAVGVYSDFVYEGRRQVPAEVLMGFALDGQGARRKGIRNGVALEWSHDNQWVLVQDGAKACMMRANGGQYKCWRGYTAASIAPNGSYALVLGNRDGSRTAPKKSRKAPAKKPDPDAENEPDDPASGAAPVDDVAVAPPSGPLALYRAKLDGPYDNAPQLVVKVIDGTAVWIPGK
jgi:hypothetical protein